MDRKCFVTIVVWGLLWGPARAQEAGGAGGEGPGGPGGLSPERMTQIGRAVSERLERAFLPAGGSADYAAAAVAIGEALVESAATPEGRLVFGQLGPPWLTMTGRETLAQRVWEEGGAGTPPAPAAPDSLEAADAIAAIVEASRGRRVVMLNEAHHVPMHRAFGARLVRALAAEGFTHLGVEALGNSAGEGWTNPAVRARRPVVDAGFYTREPVFGSLLRGAFDAGLVVFPYETTDTAEGASPAGRINAREASQAERIARVLREDPGARVIVYCGYAHLTEAPAELMGEEVRWLGLRLRDLLGIDPLTVSQIELTPASTAERDTPGYRSTIDRYRVRDVAALRTPDGRLWSGTPGAADITLLHPRAESVQGRPGFLFLGAERRARPIPGDWLPRSGPALVQALVEGEHAGDAVPADQVWVEEGEGPTLALARGRYRVRVFDSGARLHHEGALVVE